MPSDSPSKRRPRKPKGPKAGEAPQRLRLHRLLADLGLGSRRACEEMIEDGRIAVNGEIMRTLPVLVDPSTDRVEVDGVGVRLPGSRGSDAVGDHTVSDRIRHVYVMLYKPRHTVTTMHDPDGRRTVAELVVHPSGARLYPVGRLDYDTMGLVLMTNDGDLANALTHPRFGMHKTYRAIVKGQLTEEDVAKLHKGLYLADREDGRTIGASRTAGVDLRIVKSEPSRTILDMTLREGRNRQIRRMLAKLGCPVRKLVRIAMGPVSLKGVALGAWRELTRAEVDALRRAASGRGPKGLDAEHQTGRSAMKLGRSRRAAPAPTPDPAIEARAAAPRTVVPARPSAPIARPLREDRIKPVKEGRFAKPGSAKPAKRGPAPASARDRKPSAPRKRAR